MTRRSLLGIAAIVVGAVWWLLPPRAEVLAGAGGADEPVRGTIHVHTRRSDGSGTMDDVAAAAARAGLRFVVFSDHGNATRTPQPPAYRHGVLCIDAIEIATFSGHVLAIGLGGAAPYPLAGESRDVIEDVARLGGMSVAAHPTSPKPALRWRDWGANLDGLEWLNADSEWRDERPLTLFTALLTYPFRRAETLTSLLNRPVAVLAQWDRLLRERRVVGIAGADAHASMVNGEDNPYSDRSPIALPGYEQSFRTFSVALPNARLSGDAAADASSVIDEIRHGRLYTAIDGLAHPAQLTFAATSGAHHAQGGETLPLDGPVTIDVRTNVPAGGRIVLIRDGRNVAQRDAAAMTFTGDAVPGYYRVEVSLRAATAATSVPWIVSNPIYVGARPPSAERFVVKEESVRYRDGVPGDGWGIEKSDKSRGVLDVVRGEGGTRLLLQYALGGTKDDDPYVALGMPAGPEVKAFTHLAFRARAERPMRIWVQFWRPVPTGNEYWRRSVYLDPSEREIVVPFSEMSPSAPDTPAAIPLSTIVSIMFVVDQVHTPLGAAGKLWIGDVRYQR